VLAMSTLNEPIAKRIATLFRLLGSNHDGEALAAIAAMKRLFTAERLTFHDIATVIESCNGEIEEKKYSDADAAIIFQRGMEKGRVEEARKRSAPPEFYDIDGRPRWSEIARFCQQHLGELRSDWERTFVKDMAGKTLWSQPTEKQAKHLLGIFVKLGGHYDTKAANAHR
jgi:hypothetical protein